MPDLEHAMSCRQRASSEVLAIIAEDTEADGIAWRESILLDPKMAVGIETEVAEVRHDRSR